jgi:hypothetical protein
MRRLLEATPDDQLDDRFPGDVTMTIGPAGLAHENDLVALIGRTPEQLGGVRSVSEVRSFAPTFGGLGLLGVTSFQQVFLFFGTALLLVPIVITVFMVTRVGWAQRQQRLTAIRLVGATRLQTAVLTGMETGFAAAVGTGLAWATYEVGRRIAAERIVFQGGHFWPEDMAVQPWLLVLILAGTPALVMLASIWSMAWATNTPALHRYGRRPAPRTWTTLPLGLAVAGTLAAAPLEGAMGPDLAGFFMVVLLGAYVLGFVLIGPWLCRALSIAIARISRGVPGLIAAHRIAADPYAAFRSVGTVVLAVSAITYFGTVGGQLAPSVGPQYVLLRPGVVVVNTGGVPQSQVAPLLTPETVVVRVRGEFGPDEVTCAELARVRYLSCPDGSDATEPSPDLSFLPVREIYIPTDGSLVSESRLRVKAANLVPNAIINSDRDPMNHEDNYFAGFDSLVYLASLFVLLLAVVGLTAGLTAGLLERRRPFALLRASGVQLGELRRVVLLETSATMVLTSTVGVVLGMVLGYAATRRAGLTWTWPPAEVYAFAGGAVLAALALSTLALPLLNTATRFDAIRYE